jgi:hypothetical protein
MAYEPGTPILEFELDKVNATCAILCIGAVQ